MRGNTAIGDRMASDGYVRQWNEYGRVSRLYGEGYSPAQISSCTMLPMEQVMKHIGRYFRNLGNDEFEKQGKTGRA